MVFSTDFWRALAKYRLMFTDIASLGASYATWLAELERVEGTKFAQVLITSAGNEGGNQSGEKGFDGGLLVDALHCRRYELEAEEDVPYELPEHLAGFPSAKLKARARRGTGFSMQFNP